MSDEFRQWSEYVVRLHRALVDLRADADFLGVPWPDDFEWFQLLERKLLPQLTDDPWLIVAVVGGTNIGKSVIFNHLAGENASGVSPLAAGTKHPVCLVPEKFSEQTTLTRLFPGFDLRGWQDAKDPLAAAEEDLLFWRTGQSVSKRLLLLDTPDVDSDAPVNWRRADHIRRTADVLIAVLTQQKYNDAAVKRFFRAAAEAGKPVIAVFNQCDLSDDREFWPLWLETFRRETGAEIELVYVVPYDRQSSVQLALPFYAAGVDGKQLSETPSSLRDDLASLKFDTIKIRTLHGAMSEVLDSEQSVGGYLETLRKASGEFHSAAAALAGTEMARVVWPSLPSEVLIDEIRDWWDQSRSGWSRGLHGFYRKLGSGITWPVRKAWSAVAGPGTDPVEDFRRRERTAVVRSVEAMIMELERLAKVGNAMLRPRLETLLSGSSRADLLARAEVAHESLSPIDDDFRKIARRELEEWSEGNPRVTSVLRRLDTAVALARPAITVSLAVSGWMVAGGLVHDAAVQAAGHTAGQLATEAAITGGITGGGEAIVDTTGAGLRRAAAQLFRRLQEEYAASRAAWLAGWLEEEFLGDLLNDLKRGAQTTDSEAVATADAAIRALTGE
ncbi:MAG: 50S ribosome-binding GTPase [Pirellulales bacterium]|nr:50S ribosome-binding GTPase [Pirellulales bacterium]